MEFTTINSPSDKFYLVFLTELLKSIRPVGECREGQFSSVCTDVPLSGEIKTEKDGSYSYEQYEYEQRKWRKAATFIDYESCTGSKISFRSSLFGIILGFENIGSNTRKKIEEALDIATKDGHVDTKQRINEKFFDLLEKTSRKEN